MRSMASARTERGSVTLETALILFPFLVVVVAIIELTLTLAAQEMLDSNTARAARELSVGGIIGTNNTTAATKVRDLVCDGGLMVMNATRCKAELKVGITAVSGTGTIPRTVVGGAINSAAFTVSVSPNAILLVRTGIAVPKFLNVMSPSSILDTGMRFLTSGAIAKLDPYAEYNKNGSSVAPSF